MTWVGQRTTSVRKPVRPCPRPAAPSCWCSTPRQLEDAQDLIWAVKANQTVVLNTSGAEPVLFTCPGAGWAGQLVMMMIDAAIRQRQRETPATGGVP